MSVPIYVPALATVALLAYLAATSSPGRVRRLRAVATVTAALTWAALFCTVWFGLESMFAKPWFEAPTPAESAAEDRYLVLMAVSGAVAVAALAATITLLVLAAARKPVAAPPRAE